MLVGIRTRATQASPPNSTQLPPLHSGINYGKTLYFDKRFVLEEA